MKSRKESSSRIHRSLTGELKGLKGCMSSNSNEPKQNDASIIGVFSVEKRNEPTYSRTWKDRNEANTINNIHCRIEEITNIISPEFAGSKIKRI